jgi:hypothetical protein
MATRSTTRYKLFGKEFLSGGLNITDNAIIVPFNQMTVADNILVGATRARRKRFGTTLYNITTAFQGATYPTNPDNGGGAEPIRGILEYTRFDTGTGQSKTDLVVRQDDKFWTIDDRNTAAVNRSGALTLSDTGRVCFQPFETGTGHAIFFCSTDTADLLNYWDGSAGAAVTITAANAPGDWKTAGVVTSGPAFLEVHYGRLWAAGHPDFPYRLYYSAPNDGDDWRTASGGGSFDLDVIGDPQGITGLVSFQNKLYIFMRRAIYELVIPDPTDVPGSAYIKPLTREIGCVSHASIKTIGNDVIFCSDRGVTTLASTDKAIQTQFAWISRDIQRTFNEALNHARLEQIWAEFDEQQGLYMIAMPSLGSNTNDLLYCFNIESGGWMYWPAMKARSMCRVLVSNKPRICIGREDGHIVLIGETLRKDLQKTGTSSAGTDYNARFKTGILYPGDQSDVEHVFKSVTVMAAASTTTAVTLQWEIDGKVAGSRQINFTASGDLLGSSFVLGASQLATNTFVPRTVQIAGKGYGLQLSVIMPSSADIEIYGFIIETKAASPKYV